MYITRRSRTSRNSQFLLVIFICYIRHNVSSPFTDIAGVYIQVYMSKSAFRGRMPLCNTGAKSDQERKIIL